MTISIIRLRSLCVRAASEHAGLVAANDRQRAAKRTLIAAREALALFESTRHTHVYAANKSASPGNDDGSRNRARLAKDVDLANQGLEAAEAAQADAHDRWTLASGLASRGRDYAASLGLLPPDLEF